MYGVLGTGSAPAKVIHASLNDIGKDKHFVIPWYGVVTPGIESVYDWVLDNNIEFTLVQDPSVKKCPAVLRTMCTVLVDAEEVDKKIVSVLRVAEDGHALVLWDEEDEAVSVNTATAAISAGLPTLELTNGLVPIVFHEEDVPAEIVESDNDFVIEGVADEEVDKFSREELENMPAAVVKRMAAGMGVTAKTKDEAINAIAGEAVVEDLKPVSAPT
jgi:hypothetical protein